MIPRQPECPAASSLPPIFNLPVPKVRRGQTHAKVYRKLATQRPNRISPFADVGSMSGLRESGHG
jgi:hypothetical protein